MKQKVISRIIICLGIGLAITGVLLLLYGKSHTGFSGGVSRADTDIEFGADFYTTSAQYTALSANTLTDIYDLIRICFGILFVFSGAITVCLQLKSNNYEKDLNVEKPPYVSGQEAYEYSEKKESEE